MNYLSRITGQFVGVASAIACLILLLALSAHSTARANFLVAQNEAQATASALNANGRIAFVSDRDGVPNIYTMNPDGSNVVRLTNFGINIDPAWSPDGTRLAFASNRTGSFQIFVMNADGTNQQRLTNDPTNDSEPAWSPDGAFIAFTKTPFALNNLASLSGTTTTLPTQSPLLAGFFASAPISPISPIFSTAPLPSLSPSPSPSPTGSPVPTPTPPSFNFIVVPITPLPGTPSPVLASNVSDIFVMNSDGSNQKRLTDGAAPSNHPVWSPDGAKIAFTRLTTNVSFTNANGSPLTSDLPSSPYTLNVYVMNADGSNPTKLTSGASYNANPAWSPDGKRLAFSRGLSGAFRNSEIFLMNADGSGLTQLTNQLNVNDDHPTWSPDGTKLAFQRFLINGIVAGNWDIYVINADGSNPTGITFTTNVSDPRLPGSVGFFLRNNVEPAWQAASIASPTPVPTPSPTPVPANFAPAQITADQTSLDVFTFADRAYVNAKLTFPTPDYQVDFGQITKTNNDLSVDVKANRFIGGGVPQVVVTLNHIYLLSGLAPGNYTFTLNSRGALLKSKAFSIGGGITSKSNPIDNAAVFVDQHYRDFLNREPEDGGLNYWIDQFSRCERTNDAQCMSDERVSVSSAFFIEQEFQQTGSFVYRMYKGSLGRQPVFAEFMPERAQVIGGANLDASKQAFANAWVQRTEFLQKYPQSLSTEQLVDALLKNVRDAAGVDLSAQRADYLNTMQQSGRGSLVRQIIEEQAFQQAEYNRAFVLMQYFGYLRRDPDESGYQFWLDVLNNRAPNNYRGMVNAFITSAEYRARFGQL